MKIKLILGASILLLVSSTARATVITFDDVSTITDNTASIYDGYNGFDWQYKLGSVYLGSLSVLNTLYYETQESGYVNGTVSGEYVALSPGGRDALISRDELWDFNSAYFTAAWNDGLSLTLNAFNDAQELLHTHSQIINTDGPSLIELNWLGISSFEFVTSGGTSAGLDGSGKHVAIDNFTFNVSIPEPITPCETSTITCLHIPEVSNLDADDVEAYTGTESELTLFYKNDFDAAALFGAGEESGLYKDNYSTEYETDEDGEPTGADIFHDLGDIINCAECYLVVKDGRQGDPAQYLFDISDSGDLMTLALSGFWDGEGVQGAISNIAIYGVNPVPVPAAIWLFGTALIGFIGISRRRKVA